MRSINQVVFSGTLGRDIEVKAINADLFVGKFSLAVSEGVKKNGQWENKTYWLDFETWSKKPENLDGLLKGTKVVVTGRVKVDEWQDKETGKKRTAVRFVADQVEILGSRMPSQPQAGGYSDQGEDGDLPPW